MSTILRGPRENGESVVLGVKMGCHSKSIRLVRENEYNGGEKMRPLSPVRLRTMLPEDIQVEKPPTLKEIHDRNEVKALNSPFIRHKSRRERETWLLNLGSLSKPKDDGLQKELDLQSQLNKIISPIKVKRNARNLHKPKMRKMPEHLQNEILEDEYLKEKQKEEQVRYEQEQMYFYNQQGGSSWRTATPKSIKSRDSSQGAVAMTPITTHSLNASTDGAGDSLNHREPHDEEENSMWPPFSQRPGGTPLLNIHHPATPISDLSDRDVLSAGSMGSHLSGMYGDFEDDLISAGGSHHDDEFILEEML